MCFDEEAVHFANHERCLHFCRGVYSDFFGAVPVFGLLLVLVLLVLVLVMKRCSPSLDSSKKLVHCYNIGVVYRIYPVVVVGGGMDIEAVSFATADALDLGAKVCPLCCGGRVVVVVSNKFQAFPGVILCSPEFDRSVLVFGLYAWCGYGDASPKARFHFLQELGATFRVCLLQQMCLGVLDIGCCDFIGYGCASGCAADDKLNDVVV